MFTASAIATGIVQGKATVRSVRKAAEGDFTALTISFPAAAVDGVQIGASVAINGTCLTVTSIKPERDGTDRTMLGFDVISETLRRTNLGQLEPYSSVNFERSARMGDEIGGHQVSGHVHTMATLADLQRTENNRRLEFKVPCEWTKYLLPKGFVAVNGCSLTVGEVTGDSFSVYLIPETLRVTVLGDLSIGSSVNVEIDAQTQAIVDTVERVVARYMAAVPKVSLGTTA